MKVIRLIKFIVIANITNKKRTRKETQKLIIGINLLFYKIFISDKKAKSEVNFDLVII